MPMKSMSCDIDTVTFDLWFTLISHDETYDGRIRESRIRGIIDALADNDIEAKRSTILKAYDDSERFLSERWASNRDVDSAEQLEILLRCAGIDPLPEIVTSVEPPYVNAVLEVEPFLVEGAMEALEAVRSAGLKTALISNTGRTPGKAMREVMKRMGILGFFDSTIFSNEVGYLKPDGRIFEATLGKLGSDPGRSVHVGDHQVLDVQGAKAFGMKSVHVTRYCRTNGGSCQADLVIDTIGELPQALKRLKP